MAKRLALAIVRELFCQLGMSQNIIDLFQNKFIGIGYLIILKHKLINDIIS
jgi:hypothetical protein